MITKYVVVFMISWVNPFCLSESSEEYRDEERVRSNYGREIQWTGQGQVVTSYKSSIEPAGYDETFLCRAYHDKNWVPGKLIGRSCYITKNRVEYRFEEFQVPSIPAYQKSRWVVLNKNAEKRQLPRNVVVGGKYWDATAYICRGLLSREHGIQVIIPGSYHPIENTCYVEHNGAQVAWKGETEVLVLDQEATTSSNHEATLISEV